MMAIDATCRQTNAGIGSPNEGFSSPGSTNRRFKSHGERFTRNGYQVLYATVSCVADKSASMISGVDRMNSAKLNLESWR